MSTPLLWLISTSLKEPGTEFVFPPEWIPNPIVWNNYVIALTKLPFHLYFAHTLLITVVATAGAVVTASMAAFGFARIKFGGRDFLFVVLLSTLMLPDVVTLVPKYVLFSKLHWINTYLPLTVPYWFGGGAFNIFLIRQFFMTLPYDLDEAAKIDGASHFQVYWRLLLPLSIPALTAVTMFAVIFHWNDFLGPLIYLNDPQKRTLALGLQGFQDSYRTQWSLLMAASTAMIAPIIVLFFAAQRFFIRGIQLTGLSGR
jgi:multiple sugar transport system permease protein